MEFNVLAVKALSGPLILGWGFPRNYMNTISSKTHTITWDDGTSTVAVRNYVVDPALTTNGV